MVERLPESEERLKQIFNKTDGRCYVCGKHLSYSNRTYGDRGAWHVGHLIAKDKGGSENLRNKVPLCAPHNLKIGTMGVQDYIDRRMEADGFVEGAKEVLGWKVVRRRPKRG
jgi:5-methylcytosine-specific restriction endonuclease McrA